MLSGIDPAEERLLRCRGEEGKGPLHASEHFRSKTEAELVAPETEASTAAPAALTVPCARDRKDPRQWSSFQAASSDPASYPGCHRCRQLESRSPAAKA